jgi:hypothetical protein
MLLIYKSNGPVLGAAPFNSNTFNVDPEGNDMFFYSFWL